MIAWRYLRARRSHGGISVMTWISLIGITLAVFALIVTLAVRSGFRAEFVDTILGANAHATVYSVGQINPETGRVDRTIGNYDAAAENLRKVEGVIRVAPLVKGQVMANANQRSAGVEVFGITLENLKTLPRIADPEMSRGDIDDFREGVAIGSGVARALGVNLGDQVSLISPNGIQTAFGTSPRINAYEVVYIFTAGRYNIDRVRAYLPFSEAQVFFNREGRADELELMVSDPETVDSLSIELMAATEDHMRVWSWKDASGGYLHALEVEDNVMFVIMSVLVLIASMNIVSGLIMLVKNKGRDIGILRTIGLSEGAVLRVFFICGAFTGIIGTACGTLLGCLAALNLESVFLVLDHLGGQPVWNPDVRPIARLPSNLELGDVALSVALSLGLSFTVTYFPARRAAKLNPVEALRRE
ncbi:MAG: lipoprotein-releasing ABC transporter permease subunit [Roseovarius sp.]|nr:lipoprotein-releasing ABC transporter permease subunit [Roseovarius sp.]